MSALCSRRQRVCIINLNKCISERKLQPAAVAVGHTIMGPFFARARELIERDDRAPPPPQCYVQSRAGRAKGLSNYHYLFYTQNPLKRVWCCAAGGGRRSNNGSWIIFATALSQCNLGVLCSNAWGAVCCWWRLIKALQPEFWITKRGGSVWQNNSF